MRKLSLLFFILLLGSCISNKKTQYLQYDDVNVKEGEIAVDSIVRNYKVNLYDYRIQPNDVLSVEVESLTKEEYDIFAYTRKNEVNTGAFANNAGALYGELVDEEGNIEFPVIGKVEVAGLTLFEVQDKMAEIASQYLENPVVSVRMLNFRFTVLGEVFKEGNVTTYNNRTTLLEAIGLAGGLTDLGDRSTVKLIRQKGENVDVQYIDLLDESFINSPYYYIHQNDIIIVPPIKQRPFRKYFGENLSFIVSSLTLLLLVFQVSQ